MKNGCQTMKCDDYCPSDGKCYYEGDTCKYRNTEEDVPINIIFDGPPGPNAGRFIEVETDDGKSINIGEWKRREDGLWSLRITILPRGEK